MQHSRSLKQILILLLVCSSLFGLHHLAFADPPYSLCPKNNSFNPLFETNLNNLLSLLLSNASISNNYHTCHRNGTHKIYGQYMCLDYVTNQACQGCITGAKQAIMDLCPNKTDAVVWEETCQLRYSDTNFLGQLNVTGNKYQKNDKNVADPPHFRFTVEKKLKNLTKIAASEANRYAIGNEPYKTEDTLYALVQCTLDLSSDDCNKCLETAINNVLSWSYGSRGARLLSRSCYLRYEFYAFYVVDNKASVSKNNHGITRGGADRRTWLIVAFIIGSAVLVIVLPVSFFYRGCGAMKKRNRRGGVEYGRNQVELHNIGDSEKTDFHGQYFEALNELKANDSYIDLTTIQLATDNFSDSNKLGQGGFGPVYKGVLADGKEIAVKRLSSFSEQGTLEFTNEVLLILKLQHKNLVRLLGFCVDQKEKLLIYEFLPNNSLDVFLFDPNKRKQLNWSKRLNLINGIAKGILYLHEDSRLRIIHRDLKASNVLLDFDMNPKISDFGLARIFEGADDEANTATIAGTYGYMAPEYAMHGLYSVKSDVFSFGVLLLEIVTGEKNACYNQSKLVSLVEYAWHLWNEGNVMELMDPLVTDGSPYEFLRLIHIGLLCVQEDAIDRPTMSSMVVMLKDENVTLGQPQQPAFFVGRFAKHYQTHTVLSMV